MSLFFGHDGEVYVEVDGGVARVWDDDGDAPPLADQPCAETDCKRLVEEGDRFCARHQWGRP